MNIIIELLKKDLLKFRWLLLLWLALIVTWHAALFVLNAENFKTVYASVSVLQVLAILFLPVLTLLVVQADAAAGGTAFWLTRPLPPWKILASKTLLLLSLMVPLAVAVFISTMALFQSSAADAWHKTLNTVQLWFWLMPLYALVAAVTRNFSVAFGTLLALIVAFFASATIFSENRIYFYLWWVPIAAVPLTGVIVQYYTRRAWLTVSGCVLAAVITTVVHPPSPFPEKQRGVEKEPEFAEQIAVKNISVNARDENVIVSGEFDMPEHREFEWKNFPLTFNAANGGAVTLLNARISMHGQREKIMKFSFTLRPVELKRLGKKSGTLRIHVGGRFFHYEPLTVVPLDGKRWMVVEGTRITAARLSDDADVDTVARLLFFGALTDIVARAREETHLYQYALCRADDGPEITLQAHAGYGMSDFTLCAQLFQLRTREPLPQTLDDYSVRISRRVYNRKEISGTTIEIPHFTASGTAPAAAEKL
ncbi:MAG: hypothetical protein LBK71_06330 [Verrucomicrobiales bacterium]|jgi:hypothetical protein|nr:hypothetical protein [Verrucomicrobiales bacterium]